MVESKGEAQSKHGYSYRMWHWTEMNVQRKADTPTSVICLDTGAGMTVIDRPFLLHGCGRLRYGLSSPRDTAMPRATSIVGNVWPRLVSTLRLT